MGGFMSSIVVSGDTSGAITIAAPAVAGTNTLNLPAQNGTLAINSTFAFKNRLINAGYIINQRSYTSGTSLSSGSYGHDRWKGGASGGTYTFTQGSAGVPIVITITAGAIQQVIEGCNLPEGGTYTLSWVGTATASINGATAASSPITVTGVTAGANMTIQFNTGTVSYPQLETGSQATSFDYRSFGHELMLCQRYYELYTFNTGTYQTSVFQSISASACYGGFMYKVTKRVAPTITIFGTMYATNASGTAGNAVSISGYSASIESAGFGLSTSGLSAGDATGLYGSNTGFTLSAEL